MKPDCVVAPGSPFVDNAVRVDQVVVADIAPAAAIGVERPLGANTCGPVWLAAVERIAVSGVMDDHVFDRVVGCGCLAVLSIGAAPSCAGDNSGLCQRVDGGLAAC